MGYGGTGRPNESNAPVSKSRDAITDVTVSAQTEYTITGPTTGTLGLAKPARNATIRADVDLPVEVYDGDAYSAPVTVRAGVEGRFRDEEIHRLRVSPTASTVISIYIDAP